MHVQLLWERAVAKCQTLRSRYHELPYHRRAMLSLGLNVRYLLDAVIIINILTIFKITAVAATVNKLKSVTDCCCLMKLKVKS